MTIPSHLCKNARILLKDQTPTPIRCHTCGLIDTHQYCSRCGTALRAPSSIKISTLRTLSQYLGDTLVTLLIPILAASKTFWLIAIRPRLFFAVLFDEQGTIDAIDFPLSNLWRRLSRERLFQNTLEPLSYYIAALVFGFFFIASPTLDILRGGLLWQSAILADVTDALINQGVILMMLIYSLLFITGFALVFGLVVPKEHLPATHIYNFWLYTFSTLLGSLAITYFITFSLAESFPEDNGLGLLIVFLIILLQLALAVRLVFVTPFQLFSKKIGWPRVALGLFLASIYWLTTLFLPFYNLTTAAIFLSPIYLIINSTPLLLLAGLLFILFKTAQSLWRRGH